MALSIPVCDFLFAERNCQLWGATEVPFLLGVSLVRTKGCKNTQQGRLGPEACLGCSNACSPCLQLPWDKCRGTHSRVQAWSTNWKHRGEDTTWDSSMPWLNFQLPCTDTLFEKTQTKLEIVGILPKAHLICKIHTIRLTRIRGRPGKILSTHWGGWGSERQSSTYNRHCLFGFQVMALEGRQNDEYHRNKNWRLYFDCCQQNGETGCFGWPDSPHFL